MNHFISVVFCPVAVACLQCIAEILFPSLDLMLCIALYIIPDVIWNDTFGGVVPRVVDDGGDSVPGERFHWVQEVSDVSRGVGGVKPRPHSLLATENGWHAMVDLGERRT